MKTLKHRTPPIVLDDIDFDIELDDLPYNDDEPASLAEVDETRRAHREAQAKMQAAAIEYRHSVRRFANHQLSRGLSKREIANLCGISESALRDLLRTDADGNFIHRDR